MRHSNKTRRALWSILALSVLCLPACTSDGHFSIAGYSTQPNFDNKVATVYVPIFKNVTFRRRLEFDLTKAVIREIELTTPYKVVSDPAKADSVLLGTIRVGNKQLLNRNQQNTIREGQTLMAVELVWKDLRTGEILSSPRRGSQAPLINRELEEPPLLMPLPGPSATTQPLEQPKAPPPIDAPAPIVLVQAVGSYVPELGGSTATGWKQAVDRMATKIVHLMEKPW